jgi:hypothetical protein
MHRTSAPVLTVIHSRAKRLRLRSARRAAVLVATLIVTSATKARPWGTSSNTTAPAASTASASAMR